MFIAGRSGRKRQDEDHEQTAQATATNFAGITSSTGEFARLIGGTASRLYMCQSVSQQQQQRQYQQVAQLSQRDRAAGWVSNGQKWKTGTERQYLRTV